MTFSIVRWYCGRMGRPKTLKCAMWLISSWERATLLRKCLGTEKVL